MSFFSGILGKIAPIAGSAIGTYIGGPFGGSIGGAIGSGVAGGFSEQADASAVSAQNRFNAEQAELNRAWQAEQAKISREFNSSEAGLARDFNSEEAYKAREYDYWQTMRANEFSERMRNTQYQSAVADMRAAGINPMVAFSQGGNAAPTGQTGGGPSASGPAASSSAPGGSAASASQTRFPTDSATSAMQAIKLFADAKQVAASTENVQADTENKLATAANIDADTALKTRQAYQANTQGNVNQAAEKEMLERVNKTRAETEQSTASAENVRAMNLAVKDLMSNPATRPFAAILQLLFKR